MKANLTVLLSIALGSGAPAQTLTDDGNTPVPGDVFVDHLAAMIWLPGPPGTGLTWNLSGVDAGTLRTTTYVDSSATPYASLFPSATVAQPDINGYYFYRGGASFDWLGSANANNTTIMEDPWTFIGYPCAFGSTWSDDFMSSADTIWGSTDGVADATGTLVMPYGTVNNVLRVQRTYALSFMISGDTMTITATAFIFYKPGLRTPLMGVLADGSALEWLDGASVGVAEAVRNDIGIAIAPVPAHTTLNITFSAPGGELTWNVTAADGALVDQRSIRGAGILQEQLDVSHMAPGLYCLTITDEGGDRGVARFVVE